jgi:RNA polymerase sigma-70 factor (ECF subfamily)
VNDDVRLIEEALAGQTVAFCQLVRKYQDRLYNTMVHLLGSREDAYDVVQDAFVQAFVKLETFQRTSSFYTWIFRIAHNTALSFHRRRRNTESVDKIRELSGGEPVDDAPGPTDRLEQQERVNQVQAALSSLSEEHRTILVLREMDNFEYDVIAEMLALPVGTVRSRLHRARMQLREELKKVLQEDFHW